MHLPIRALISVSHLGLSAGAISTSWLEGEDFSLRDAVVDRHRAAHLDCVCLLRHNVLMLAEHACVVEGKGCLNLSCAFCLSLIPEVDAKAELRSRDRLETNVNTLDALPNLSSNLTRHAALCSSH